MDRTTISLPPELHDRLRVMAAERGISISALIREFAEERTGIRKRRFLSAGAGASGHGTLAQDSADMEFEPPPWRS